jgi:hypothetical protein
MYAPRRVGDAALMQTFGIEPLSLQPSLMLRPLFGQRMGYTAFGPVLLTAHVEASD